MLKIDSAAQLAAVIRSRFETTRRNQGAGKSAERSQARPSQAVEEAANSGDVPDLIAQRVGQIKPDDPQRERKAFRIFLECVLADEFGAGLAGDVKFQQLVDRVQQEMESDADLAKAMREAAILLLEAPAQR